MTAVFKREFKSYFSNPLGYIIIAVFTFFSGMAFSMIFAAGSPSIQGVVNFMSSVVIFATPFITMRLISDDKRQKVDQILLTSPASVSGIVMGKFLAAMALYALGLSSLIIYPFIVSFYTTVDWVLYLYSVLGILLLGAVMISVGMFISSLTESPVISAAITFAVFLAVMLLGSYASSADIAFLATLNSAVSFIDRFYSFTSGVSDLADVVYMVSISGLFVFLTVRSVERRRWA